MKNSTENARTIINTYTDQDHAAYRAAKAVLDGSCQWMQVHWAIDALAEATREEIDENVEIVGGVGSAVDAAEQELTTEWTRYARAAGVRS